MGSLLSPEYVVMLHYLHQFRHNNYYWYARTCNSTTPYTHLYYYGNIFGEITVYTSIERCNFGCVFSRTTQYAQKKFQPCLRSRFREETFDKITDVILRTYNIILYSGKNFVRVCHIHSLHVSIAIQAVYLVAVLETLSHASIVQEMVRSTPRLRPIFLFFCLLPFGTSL